MSKGLALAADLGMKRFVLSSNYDEAVRAMNEGSMEIFGHVVREIKQMTRSFRSVIFQYEKRRSNVDVLYLAKSAMCSMYSTQWRIQNPGRGAWAWGVMMDYFVDYSITHCSDTIEAL